MAPVDIFNALDKKTLANFPEFLLPSDLKATAFDVEIHWVNENGGPAKLTSGMTVQTTVST